MYARKFLKSWLTDWFALMSGAPTVPLAILALYVTSQRLRILYGTLAILCVVLSAYRIWLREHKAFQFELQKHQFPQIDAKFTRFQLAPKPETIPLRAAEGQQVVACEFDIFAEVFFVNQSDAACTIQGWEGTAQLDNREVTLQLEQNLNDRELMFEVGNGRFRREELLNLVTAMSGIALHRGIGYRGWIRFTTPAIRNIDADRLEFALKIVDSFGGKHDVMRRELEADGRVERKRGPRITTL